MRRDRRGQYPVGTGPVTWGADGRRELNSASAPTVIFSHDRFGLALYTARVRGSGSRIGFAVVLVVCLCVPEASAQPEPVGQPDARPTFAEWLAGLRSEALQRGLREDVVDGALADVQEPLSVVIERDRAQAEIVLPLEGYIERRLSRGVVRTAREMLTRHQSLLAQVSERYGVSARTLVAIWGLESNFGRFAGVRPTIGALATLAWDPRRSALFRRELLGALEILNRGDIELARMRGSWAGAMGQPQFMPSSYLRFAEDFDGDGRRDIWHSAADVFASIASYLKGHGWVTDERWGREVSVPAAAATTIAATVERRHGSCQATRNMSVALPVSEWSRFGVRAQDGGPLPDADMPAALVSGSKRHFLVYGNYDALLAYNCAHAYAVTVGLLADRIGTMSNADGARPVQRRAAPTEPGRPR